VEDSATVVFFFFFITLGLELSDTTVYEPEIRALLGTAHTKLLCVPTPAASGRRGDNLKGFKEIYMKAKAIIWP
jgi:hypothetical protein